MFFSFLFFNVRKVTMSKPGFGSDTNVGDRPWEFYPDQSAEADDRNLPRKEVIHPQLPLRMPCYDFVPIAGSAFVPSSGPSGVSNSLDVTGGEYKTRERIHGGDADPPLLANPAS